MAAQTSGPLPKEPLFPLNFSTVFFLVIITALLSWLISLRWLPAAKPNP